MIFTVITDIHTRIVLGFYVGLYTDGILNVIVDPNQFRENPCLAQLIKFHGCIVSASEDPDNYRSRLVATEVGILGYGDDKAKKAIHDKLISIASESRVLTAGLSLQDINLVQIFSKAKALIEWDWDDKPPVIVCCEEKFSAGQKMAMQLTYGDTSFAENKGDIMALSHLRSWPEKVFLGLVLKLISKKLLILAENSLSGKPVSAEFAKLVEGLKELENFAVANADKNLEHFTHSSIAVWSRLISLFRNGTIPSDVNQYMEISRSSLSNVLADGNATSSGFGELAFGLSLFGNGLLESIWQVNLPNTHEVKDGAFTCLGKRAGAKTTKVFFVKSANVALELKKQGSLLDPNSVVIHSDDTWSKLSSLSSTVSARGPGSRVGRDGHYETRHVSLKELIDTNSSFDEISRLFREAVTI